MLSGVQLMFDYDAWATQRLLEAMRQLRAEEYASVEASGKGSIRDSFAHLLTVQWSWFSWLSGRLPAEEAMHEKIDPQQIATLEQAVSRWAAVREQTEKTILGLSQEAITSDLPISVPELAASSLPLWKLLLHVANHGTHTRAQISAALQRSGHAPLDTDMISMLLQR